MVHQKPVFLLWTSPFRGSPRSRPDPGEGAPRAEACQAPPPAQSGGQPLGRAHRCAHCRRHSLRPSGFMPGAQAPPAPPCPRKSAAASATPLLGIALPGPCRRHPRPGLCLPPVRARLPRLGGPGSAPAGPLGGERPSLCPACERRLAESVAHLRRATPGPEASGLICGNCGRSRLSGTSW